MQQHSILCRQVGIVVSQMRVPYGTPLKSGFPTHNQSSAGGSQLYYNMISSCYLSKEKRLQVEMKAFREVAIYNAAGSQQCHTILSIVPILFYKLLLTNFSRKVALFPYLDGQRVGIWYPFLAKFPVWELGEQTQYARKQVVHIFLKFWNSTPKCPVLINSRVGQYQYSR